MRFVALALACFAAAIAAPASAATVRMPAFHNATMPSAPRAFAYASMHGSFLGAVAPGANVSLLIHLQGRNQGELDALVNALMTPGNLVPRYLSSEEFGRYFGADPQSYARALAALRSAGIVVDWLAPNRTDIVAHGSASRVEAFFATPLDLRVENGRRFFTARYEPLVPVALGAALVSGLDDYVQYHPISLHHDASVTGGWTPDDIAGAYDLEALYAKGYDGKGVTIDNSTSGAASANDYALFRQHFNFSSMNLVSVPVGGPLRSGCGPSCGGNGESTLDADSAAGIAREATFKQVVAYNSGNHDFDLSYEYIVADKGVHVVTTSWGVCESVLHPSKSWAIDNNLLKEAVAKGQFWFSASGDNGTDDCYDGSKKVSVDYPGSSPYVISVGGTNLKGNVGGGTGGNVTWAGETTWQYKNSDGASGGGQSIYFLKPSYQNGATPVDGRRDVPDVALLADNHNDGVYVVLNGSLEGGWGGTSEAAPMWAGFFAIVEQMKGSKMPEPHARLYQLARSNKYHSYFHDITSGNNGVPAGVDPYGTFKGFNAGPGFDLTTGWGSFIGSALANVY